MNRILTTLLLAAIVPLASCSSVEVENGPLSGNARIVGSISGVEMDDAVVRFDDSDLAVYQVMLINKNDDQTWIEYRAHWFDEGGIEVHNATRTWKRVLMQGGARQAVRSIAPSMKAVECFMEFREPVSSAR